MFGKYTLFVLSRNNVLSVKKIRPAVEQVLMKKLNKLKIKWIVRESERREQGFYSIGRQQKITLRHVRRVAKKYRNENNPILKNAKENQDK